MRWLDPVGTKEKVLGNAGGRVDGSDVVEKRDTNLTTERGLWKEQRRGAFRMWKAWTYAGDCRDRGSQVSICCRVILSLSFKNEGQGQNDSEWAGCSPLNVMWASLLL